MSGGIDQRSSSKGQATNESNKNANVDMSYMAQHQVEYPAAADGIADQYGLMAGYYPYYAMPTDDMASGAMWSTGYNPIDYGSMMADYSYSGYGWMPSAARVGGSGGWDTAGLDGLKDDSSNGVPYSGYYAAADVMTMYGAQNLSNGQDHRNLAMNTLERGMQSIALDDTNAVSNGSGVKLSSSNGRPSGGSKSWATVASQPANPHMYGATRSRSSLVPRTHGGGPTSGWDAPRHTAAGGDNGRQAHDGWMASRRRPTTSGSNSGINSTGTGPSSSHNSTDAGPVDAGTHQYNPKEFDLSPKAARFFIIKSYAEDDIHRSIKYRIWCSTEYGNKRLDAAYRERQGKGPVYLLFSVNGSGHFCGIAQMMSPVDYQTSSDVWAQDKWKGRFEVKWIYIKDVPNSQLRHIRLENNEGKPVTNSRDTQEVPPEKGCQVLRVIHQYRHTTSIFDDFAHYESRQNEKNGSKQE